MRRYIPVLIALPACAPAAAQTYNALRRDIVKASYYYPTHGDLVITLRAGRIDHIERTKKADA